MKIGTAKIKRVDNGRLEIHHPDGTVTYCDGPLVIRPSVPSHISKARLAREINGYQLDTTITTEELR